MYDAFTENLYIINNENVYDRVYYQNYRFPEKELIDELLEKQKKHKIVKNKNILLTRKIRKINLMYDFLINFDLDILYDTYVKVFYKYSKYGKEITICKNPSFMPELYHLKPYLTKGEIINLGLNFQVISNNDIKSTNFSDEHLCKKINSHQMTSDMLLLHHNYIIKSEKLGLVQYYTIQGSYFMNQYLRNQTTYDKQNEYLESLIRPMWNLVSNSPKFDKSYIVYRFIQDDSFLQNLKIGNVFTEKGFMSTTRDPFYRSDLYKFGFILIKIRIPANKQGVALCLETVSHFPNEMEIIFPPNTQFKLIKQNNDCLYYHTDSKFESKIKTRYEFEWIGNNNISFARPEGKKTIKHMDFLSEKRIKSISLSEKLKRFENNFINEMYQFETQIGNKKYNVFSEWYDSTGAYKDYYAITSSSGYSMYAICDGYLLFFIELGENSSGITEMHINYYLKYSSLDSNKIAGDENLIKFFSSVAYYFDIQTVILYSTHLNCGQAKINQTGGNYKQRFFSNDTKKINIHIDENEHDENKILGGSYSSDLFLYLNSGTKKYSDMGLLNIELKPFFSYYYLDILTQTNPTKILIKEDRDEVYQIYDKIFIPIITSDSQNTISNFYIWLKDNKCYLLDYFASKIDRLLGPDKNPFKNDFYELDTSTYLYNRKYIHTYPIILNRELSIKRNILKENKNEYRITRLNN